MKVILTKEVLGLGDPGDVVQVKNGYGRNYLIPQGMALEATKKNVNGLEAERERIARAQAREAEKVQGDAQQMAGVKVSVTARAGEGGKLYGSVTNMQVAAAMAELGYDIDRRRILMDGPIKQLGEFSLKVKLHPQVVVEIELEVLPEGGELISEAEAKAEAAEVAAEEAPEVEAEAAEEPQAEAEQAEAQEQEPPAETEQAEAQEEPKEK